LNKVFIIPTLLIAGLTFATSTSATNDYIRNTTIVGAGISIIGNKNLLMINVDGDKSNFPECAFTGRLAINSDAPHFKDLVSIALAAQVSKQNTVDVYYTKTCNYFSNAADIIGIKMGQIPW